MLREMLEYVMTPCPLWARRAGYLTRAIAFHARWRRCRKAWQAHCDACQTVVRAAIAHCTRQESPQGSPQCHTPRRVVILGSGLLVEMPLAALQTQFDEVWLVDAVHLWPVRCLAWRNPALRRRTADLSGRVEPSVAGGPLAGIRFDLAISANLLSQLPLLATAWCQHHDRSGSYYDPAMDMSMIFAAHLDALRALAPVACLITDCETRLYAAEDGRVLESQPLLPGLVLPPPEFSWLWHLAPHPEEHPHVDRVQQMLGYSNLHMIPFA